MRNRLRKWQTFENEEKKVNILRELKGEIRHKGYRAGIVDRLMGLASGFLEPEFARVLAPWRSVAPDDIAWMRDQIVKRLGKSYLFRT